MQAFAASLALEPDRPETLVSYGGLLNGMGDGAGAVAAYSRAIELAPPAYAARCGLALALLGSQVTMALVSLW